MPYRVHTKRLIATAALAAATTIAACGSSSPTVSSSSTGSGSNATSSTLAFSKCMRANGVPNFPDLSGNGMRIEGNGQTISVNGISVNAPAFLTARQKCDRYMPHTQPSKAQSAQQTRRGLQFARCMRGHGVPNFPDPKVISSSDANQTVYLPGINVRAPAVQSAATACGGGPKGP
jgi:hypothetical protein